MVPRTATDMLWTVLIDPSFRIFCKPCAVMLDCWLPISAAQHSVRRHCSSLEESYAQHCQRAQPAVSHRRDSSIMPPVEAPRLALACKQTILPPQVKLTPIDVRVFNSHVPCSRSSAPILALCLKDKKEKCRSYKQQFHKVEMPSFVPAVISISIGLRRHATFLYKINFCLSLSGTSGQP